MTAIHGTHDDVVWLAGLCEGEATFDLHRGKYPRIRLAMTDRDVVGRAASLMDTKLRLSLHRAPAQPTWHSEISGERAAQIMTELLPYMGTRRSGKIAEVLARYEFETKGEFANKTSIPGPKVRRPAGIAKPVTASDT